MKDGFRRYYQPTNTEREATGELVLSIRFRIFVVDFHQKHSATKK
jgi:hypothetical protein